MRTTIALMSLALAVPAWAGQTVPAEVLAPRQTAETPRFVLLEGGRNFRDVGGYRTADGHVVKHNVLYRSGSLGDLTPLGQRRLAGLGLTGIVDLRTTHERQGDTFDLRGASPGYWTRDYDMSMGDMRSVFSDPANLTADKMTAMMAGAYRTMPKEQAPSYRELFARLQDSSGPTVVNCTAGKDRTGIASALVLTALGVPYDAVRRDFLLSNGAPGMETLQADLSGPLARLPADVVAPLVGVDGSYLDSAFAQIRRDHGSVEGYLDKELGVGPRQIAALRARMLEK